MSNTIFITANWTTGALSQQTISRQYDNNRYAVQFIGYPEGDGTEELDLYLLVWMSTAPGQKPGEITPIQLNSDQWYISNYFTQQVQVIKFQLCVLNEAGTYEAHSPIFSGRIGDSLEHDGTSHDIDVSTLFDAYREYLNELIIRAGAVVIDSTLSQSGQAADAKVVGDEIDSLKSAINDVETATNYIPQTLNENASIDTNGEGKVIKPENISAEQGWCCLCVPCNSGDIFHVTGQGGATTRLWAFADGTGTLLIQALSGEQTTDKTVIAPESAAYFAYNSRMSVATEVYKGEKPKDVFAELGEDIVKLNNAAGILSCHVENAITTQYTGRCLNSSGYVATDARYDTSEAISIDGFDYISVDYNATLYEGILQAIAFYPTSSLGETVITFARTVESGILYKIPDGAKYVRLSYQTGETHNIKKMQSPPINPINNNFVLTATANQLTAGQTLTACESIDNKKNDVITFRADVNSADFTSVSVGHGYNINYGAYLVVDATNITLYYGTSQYGEPKPHGLTIDKFVFVEIKHTNNARAEIQLFSSDGSFKLDSALVPWGGCRGNVFALSNGNLSNCVLTTAFRDWTADIYIFGDSYLGLDNERWPYYLIQDGYTKVAINGFGGATVQEEMTSFQNIIAHALPKFAVFALGMNNSDNDDSINASYKTGLDEFITTCVAKKITPILATIPNTPTRLHTFKNAYVKSLSYRYIDFAKAVGAESANSGWYSGMLSSDNTHPTQLGAKALYSAILSALPEITK